jgi:hypothetical protein
MRKRSRRYIYLLQSLTLHLKQWIRPAFCWVGKQSTGDKYWGRYAEDWQLIYE